MKLDIGKCLIVNVSESVSFKYEDITLLVFYFPPYVKFVKTVDVSFKIIVIDEKRELSYCIRI